MSGTLLTPPQTVALAIGPVSGARTVMFGRFDPSLGTVDAVILTIAGTASGTDFVQNLQVTPAQVTGSLSGVLSLLGPPTSVAPSGEFIMSVSATATQSATLGANDPTNASVANRGTLALQSGPVNTGTSLPLSALGRATFTGGGDISFAVSPSAFTSSVSAGGNFFVQARAADAATVTLQYQYGTVATLPPPPLSDGSLFSGSTLGFLDSGGPIGFILASSPTTTTPIQTHTIVPTLTNWQKSVSFTKFDPSLGKLDAINVTIIGRVTTSLSIENLGVASRVAGVTTTSFVLSAGVGGNVVTTVTTASVGGSLAAFDGAIDYAGSSGLVAQTATTSSNSDFGTSLVADSDLAAFAGLGTIDLSVMATALGKIYGPSDFSATLGTQAGAEIDLSYGYEPGVANPVRTVTNAAAAACFAAGTRILTDRGERAIETIAVGDRVITHRGDSVKVIWCGRRAVVPSHHPAPNDLHPVRIAAHAFGEGSPAREVLVSPDHAIFADGVLIPASCLINGSSIILQPVARVVWHHIELTTHDVVMAENLPAESYLDTGNRAAFEGPVMDVHPRFSGLDALEIWQRHACARQVRHGPELDRVRARLAFQTIPNNVPARSSVR